MESFLEFAYGRTNRPETVIMGTLSNKVKHKPLDQLRLWLCSWPVTKTGNNRSLIAFMLSSLVELFQRRCLPGNKTLCSVRACVNSLVKIKVIKCLMKVNRMAYDLGYYSSVCSFHGLKRWSIH